MKLFITSVLIVFSTFTVSAQELNVTGFRAVPMDLSASTHMRRDANGTPCALVKVVLRAEGASFEGNIVGDTQFRTNEYWVYLTEGTKMLRIKHISANPLMVKFSDYNINALQSKCTYEMNLEYSESSDNQLNNTQATKIKALQLYHNKEYPIAFELFNSIQQDPKAQYYIGKMYLNGEGTSKNISLAAEWLAKSANNNNVEAANELGDLYYSSIIKPIDNSHSWDKAMRLYWIGEKVNDPHALFKLGCIDLFLFKNNNNAEKHFERAAKAGGSDYEWHIAEMYLYTTGQTLQMDDNKRYEAAIKWCKEAVEHGSTEAANYLGECYYVGKLGLAKDYNMALYYLNKAEGKEVIKGHIYQDRKEYSSAFNCYKKAAERLDNPWAMYLLGYYYYYGAGTNTNKQEAYKWMKLSADNNRAEAIKFLSEHKF